MLIWDLTTGSFEVLSDKNYIGESWLDAERRFLLISSGEDLALWDLQERTERSLPAACDWPCTPVISPDGSFVVTGTAEGEVFVLPLDSEEPYLLLGHEDQITAIWVSPESDEIRTAALDGTVRIWEVPAGDRVHSLPHAELMKVFLAQTNMRIVTDADAEEGYRVEYDRFPGWETAPSW
jgi:WD40 repeat protein